MNFIEPAKFPDLEKFASRFGNIQTQEQVEALQRRIAPHLLRRVKEDVAKDIPPKEETIIDVELTTMQKQYYRCAIGAREVTVVNNRKKCNPARNIKCFVSMRRCLVMTDNPSSISVALTGRSSSTTTGFFSRVRKGVFLSL